VTNLGMTISRIVGIQNQTLLMPMSRLLTALTLLTMTYLAGAQQGEGGSNDSPSIEGRWLTHQSIVRVEGCEAGICGFVESLRLPEEVDQTTLLDIKNKDRSLRDRPIIGLNLFSRFDSITPGKTEYLKGRVYHPDHGRSYKANLRLLESGQLEIEGCVFAFCQQEAWARLPPCTPEGCPSTP
jgi:uncharacterized protein (DUF2147 family)